MTIQPVFFAVASDESESRAFSGQRLLNLYPETTPIKGKSRVAILGRPGLSPWGAAGEGEIRGSDVMANVLYVVSGDSLYRINSSGVATLIGIGGEFVGTGLVIMKNNGTQLAIAEGNAWVDYIDGYFLWGRDTSGKAYLYDTVGPTFAEIADADLFLSGTGKFQISALLSGASYDALDFATAESSPDNLIRGYVDRADIFLFGTDSTEVWFNSGDADFPFAPRNQTVIPKGIMGRDLVTSLDNSAFFVGRDGLAGGSGIVYRLNGFEAARVSTHAVEKALATVTDWSACRLFGSIVNGHAFLHVVLDSAPSWVYDCATNYWHEEDTYNLTRWQGNSHSYCYGKHLIGSCNSDEIFELDQNYYFDGQDTKIEREMISAPIGEDASYKTMGMFQVDLEAGRGLGGSVNGSNPMIYMSYSNDRGETFGNVRGRSAGTVGKYGWRVIWRMLGRFRSRVIRLYTTDPVKLAFLDYFADIE